MKEYLKIILSFFSKTTSFLLLFMAGRKGNRLTFSALFYRSSFSVKGSGNTLSVAGRTEKSAFFIQGAGNNTLFNTAEISGTIITVTGNNNRIICEEGVVLRKAVVTIRGNGCTIKIGKGTSFGGVRIISAGENNEISIGAGCLFADFIEVWGSDTHPIYNQQNEIINKERPILIGDRVWVGARAIILKGVTIAPGSIVGMGSLVINDVPESSVTVGNPNRIIKNDIHWALY